MTEPERALEWLRVANPLPADHVDPEELGRFVSYFEERSDAMTGIKTVHRDETEKQTPRWLRPALVFITSLVACLALVGGVALFVGGDESPVGPADPAAVPPAVATSHDATSPSTALATTLPNAEAIVTLLSNRLEYGSVVEIGANGLPIVASVALEESGESGTVTLFFCADAECEEAENVELISDTPWLGRELELSVAPNGDVYLLAGNSVFVYRNDELTELPLMFNWPSLQSELIPILPGAFMDDGRPVFLGAMGEQGLTLVVCDVPACATRTEVPIERSDFLQYPGVFVDGGTIRVVYAVGVPTGPPDPEAGYDGAEMVYTTKVASVTDIESTPVVTFEVVNEGLNEFPTQAAMADGGTLVMWLFSWQSGGESFFARLTCRGEACTKADAAGMGGWAFRAEVAPDLRLVNVVAENVFDPVEYQTYLDEERRISEQGLDQGAEEPEPLGANLVVFECVDTGCSGVRRSTIDARSGWWYLDPLDIAVSEDGTVYVIAGSDLVAGDPGMNLYIFPDGTLIDLVEPYEGTAVIH